MEELLQKIYDRHDVCCNQKYDDYLPYSFHLKAVVAQVKRYFKSTKFYLKYSDLQAQIYYSEMLMKQIIIAAAGHDLIEDARMTYNDVVYWCKDSEIAEIIYACTEEKGRNRVERHSDKFFEELSLNRYAVFVKLCDIMANVIYSKLTNSTMYIKYKKEFPHLKSKLYVEGEFEEIWQDLRKELSIED